MRTSLFGIVFLSMAYVLNLGAEIHWVDQKSKLSDDPRELYIDLVLKSVANTIYQDPSYAGIYQDPNSVRPYQAKDRETGYDHPKIAHTMVGIKRLENVRYCMQEVLKNNIPGDCIETGVWRGGTTILMRAILKAYGDQTRKVWVADSFAGLPPPNPDKYPLDLGIDLYNCPYLAVSLQEVQSNFQRYDLLDNQVVFLKGLFSDTLPTAPIEKIAVLRLDGDLYESTMDALVNLYPRLSVGGYVIIDDYGSLEACKQAVHDYRERYHLQEDIIPVDWAGVFWKKLN
jgi:hypothetical protein